MEFYNFFYFLYLDLKKQAKEQKVPKKVIFDQIYFTGVQALPIIAIISLLLGAIIIKEGHAYVGKFVDKSWIYKIIVSVMIRDAAPFITALIVLDRPLTFNRYPVHVSSLPRVIIEGIVEYTAIVPHGEGTLLPLKLSDVFFLG